MFSLNCTGVDRYKRFSTRNLVPLFSLFYVSPRSTSSERGQMQVFLRWNMKMQLREFFELYINIYFITIYNLKLSAFVVWLNIRVFIFSYLSFYIYFEFIYFIFSFKSSKPLIQSSGLQLCLFRSQSIFLLRLQFVYAYDDTVIACVCVLRIGNKEWWKMKIKIIIRIHRVGLG